MGNSSGAILRRRRRTAGGNGPPTDTSIQFQINAADLPEGNLSGTTVQDQTGRWDINFAGGATIQVTGGRLVSDQALGQVMATVTKNAGYGGVFDEIARWNFLDGALSNITSGGYIILGQWRASGGPAMKLGYDLEARGWGLERADAYHSSSNGLSTIFNHTAHTTPVGEQCRLTQYYNDEAGTLEFFARAENTLSLGERLQTTADDQRCPTLTDQTFRLYADFEFSAIRVLWDFNEEWIGSSLVDSIFTQWTYEDTSFPRTRDK